MFKKTVLRMGLLGIAGASLLGGCEAEGTAVPSGPIYATQRGEALTGPSTARPIETIASFLGDLPGGRAVDTLRVVSHVTQATGFTHVRLEQTVDGVRVVGAYVKATLNRDGELVHLIDKMVAAPTRLAPSGSRDDAMALARTFAHLGYQVAAAPAALGRTGEVVAFDRGTGFHADPTVERVAYVDDAGQLRLGYQVVTWTAGGNQLHHTIVDQTGTIVADELRTNSDQYNVYLEDPGKGGQTLVSGPAAGSVESPQGWLAAGNHTTINIKGNNTRTYLDAVADNTADAGGTTVTDGRFLTAAALASVPATDGNRAVAIQNLFYLTNRTHDVLYRHGFTEAAGNFQVDNFGRGGNGNDPVQAEAQDGGGTDNANFSTPADGSAPRMQMYLWSSAAPDHEVAVTAPASIAGSYGARASSFGAAFPAGGIVGDIVLANDGTGTTSDGCESIGAGVSGKIALIDRGTCDFTVKVMNAQSAGAIAVVVANNQGGTATMAMGGTNRRIRISSAMVSQNDGALLRTAGARGTVRKLANPPPMIDGDLDSDIVFHEYGHGLTWRMIGSMSGPLAGAIGEGASDTLAMLLNGDDVIGEYAFSAAGGIRRYPYTGYPLTYGAVDGGGVHNDGEIYAAIMWRLMEIFGREQLERDLLLTYFVDGMNYTPATPAWEDMRDGMLQSVALRGLGHECLIWEAFAQFGVGVGADGATTKGGRGVRIVESFTLPTTCP